MKRSEPPKPTAGEAKPPAKEKPMAAGSKKDQVAADFPFAKHLFRE